MHVMRLGTRRTLAVIAFSAGSASFAVALAAKGGLNEASGIATVVPVLISILLWGWRRPPPGASESTPDQVGLARRKLADQVLGQWRDEAEFRQLDDPVPIAVRWHMTKLNVTDHSTHIANHRYRLGFVGRADQVNRIVKQFRSLSRRRLVILGDPGMGKTTLAVLLLRELLEHPQVGDPVPVILPLASFDPAHETFQEWLARQLASEYPALRSPEYGATAISELIRNRTILPILDGLDEVPKLSRPNVIGALNISAALPMIMTCRTSDFIETVTAAGSDVLTGAAVIEPDSLEPGDAISFIKAILTPQMTRSKPWADVLANLALEPPGHLAEALTTPFSLWLLRQVYITPHSDPTELLDTRKYKDHEAIRDHLLDQLIPAIIASNRPARGSHHSNRLPFRPRHAWSPDSAHHWLSYLAYHFPSRDLTWWHLRDTLRPRSLTFTKSAIGGVLIGLATGLPLAISGVTPGLALGPALGFIYFVVFGIPNGARDNSRSRFRFTRAVLQAGLISTCLFWLMFAWVPGALTAAFLIGLVFMFATGLSRWLGESTEPLFANLRVQGRVLLLAKTIRAVDTSVGANVIFASGIVGAIIEWVSGGSIPAGLLGGAGVGMVFWFLFIIAAGMLQWVQSPASEDKVRSPRSTLNGDLKTLVLRVLILGLPTALLTWLPLWLAGHEFKLGIEAGIALGLALGLMAGLGQPGDTYLAVKARLWYGRRDIPFRLMSFLEDAHRMGLLHQVGPVYQFRHAALQDRLAIKYVINGRTDRPASMVVDANSQGERRII
jgi:NACHT domain-containing protein